MPRFKYVGPQLNLGRHGLVQPNQILELTPREAITVQDNPEFRPVSGEDKDPVTLRYGLEEMDREALYDKAVELRGQGVKLTFNKASTKAHLLRELKEVLGIAPLREAVVEETKEPTEPTEPDASNQPPEN